MRAYERLLQYARVYTTSDPESGTHPSAAREFDLAHMLVEEMKNLGIEDARVDEHCYVYGTLPATPGCEKLPALGLIAHMDTAPDASGENVNPILHENYDGNDVTLPATGMVMKTSTFPFLKELKGETLITTDGTTLLGADDKAGVAEIMTAAETLLAEGRPHGKVCIAFTPDEEIGEGRVVAVTALHDDQPRGLAGDGRQTGSLPAGVCDIRKRLPRPGRVQHLGPQAL